MRENAASIKDVLSAVIQNMSGGKKTKIDFIREAFKEAVGKEACGHAAPAAFKGKRLVVNVDSSAWMYELNLHKQVINKKLNEKLKKDGILVVELMFRIGEI